MLPLFTRDQADECPCDACQPEPIWRPQDQARPLPTQRLDPNPVGFYSGVPFTTLDHVRHASTTAQAVRDGAISAANATAITVSADNRAYRVGGQTVRVLVSDLCGSDPFLETEAISWTD